MTGRREASKARTRAAIVEAGIRLMHAHGYEAASTTAIAAAAGVSPATLFNYFPTKASIVFADDDLWTPDALPAVPGPNPRATMVRAVLDLLEQPDWTRPADDEVTRMRFDLVRREPLLRDEQAARAFALVPDLARLATTAHPGLEPRTALAQAGAIAGSVLAMVLWGEGLDIDHLVQAALDSESGSQPWAPREPGSARMR